MRKKQLKSTDTLLKTVRTGKKKDIELTEKELGQVTGGDYKSTIVMPVETKTGGTYPTGGKDGWPIIPIQTKV